MKLIKNKYTLCAASLVAATCLNAEWQLLDNFDDAADLSHWNTSYTNELSGGSIEVVANPLPSEGHDSNVMKIFPGDVPESSGNNFRAWREIPAIEYGKQGVIYMRVGIPNVEINGQTLTAQVSQVWGVTPVDTPTAWGDYSTATSFGYTNTLDSYNGGTDPNDATKVLAYQTIIENYTRDAWYDFWMVVRNLDVGQQDYAIYAVGPGLSEDDTPVKIFPFADYSSDYAPMRNRPAGSVDAAAAAMDIFLFTSTTGTQESPRGIDPVYVDDLYIDLSGDVNLSYPGAVAKTWAGYSVDSFDNADTGSWMGYVYVGAAPYIYNYALSSWVYLPEEFVQDAGSWAYLYK